MSIGVKQILLKKLNNILEEKIHELKNVIAFAKESRDEDTKSSSGDKYETGREMIQAEITKNEILLVKNQAIKSELLRINLSKQYTKVDFGSLVQTNQGNYFISVPLGKIEVENEVYFSISLASPVGKEFRGKEKGDKITFQNREYIIKNIV